MPSHHPTLRQSLDKFQMPADLTSICETIAASCAEVAVALRTSIVKRAMATNEFGDEVLTVDLISDQLIGEALKRCAAVNGFASEERPHLTPTPHEGGKYFVAFDPLDGSSIIGSNFAVGSIFGVWPHKNIIGRKAKEMEMSIVVQYGPRCTLFLAHRAVGVVEFLLVNDKGWHLATPHPFTIAEKAALFAPGNIRASNDLSSYADAVRSYIHANVTLRYTGGLVPDVLQILMKGSGIFLTPRSAKHKMKLRVVFECAPIALLVVCAGGLATDGVHDVLETTIEALDQRGSLVCGSKEDVKRFISKL